LTIMIRRATHDDVETLVRIQRDAAVAAFAHVFPPDAYPFPDDAIRTGWRAALDEIDVEVYLAEDDGEPIASVSIGGEFLRTLYVLPSHWGRGTGSSLHDFALERLRAGGCTEARLWTLAENHGARRFYEKRGWVLNGETRTVPFPPQPLDVGYSRTL